MGANKFSPMEIDAIGEIMNISLGASATAASTMLDARVDITTPKVRVQRREEFSFTNLEPAICVEITYVEGLTGNNVMLLKRNDVRAIVGMLMGMEIPDEEFELNEMNISAICEVMNQMMGASATALSELLSRTVNISTPRSFEVHSDEEFKDKYFPKEQPAMVVISFQLDIAGQLSSEFMNLMPINLAKELVHGFFPDLPDADDEEEEQTPAAEQQTAEAPAASGGSSEKMSQEAMDALFASMQGGGDTAPAEPAPVPSSTGGSSEKMSQEAMDALFASMQGGGDTAPAAETAPAPPTVVEQPLVQQPVMQQPVVQQPVMQQPMPVVQPGQMMGVQPMMPSAEAMALSQSILEMQKMQMKMLEQMQQMEKERQQVKEAPKEKEPAQSRQLKVRPGIQKSLHDASAGEVDPDGNLDMIMGVPVEVAVEIGRTRKLVKDILELNKGSLVVLDKLAGEQVDLFANGQCIAKGDVVVVDDNFGIRITQILAENLPNVER